MSFESPPRETDTETSQRPPMPGLSKQDAVHLQKIRKNAYKLDYKYGIRLCCSKKKIHFGKSFMFGESPIRKYASEAGLVVADHVMRPQVLMVLN